MAILREILTGGEWPDGTRYDVPVEQEKPSKNSMSLFQGVPVYRYSAEWDEKEHPRDKGKFASKEGNESTEAKKPARKKVSKSDSAKKAADLAKMLAKMGDMVQAESVKEPSSQVGKDNKARLEMALSDSRASPEKRKGYAEAIARVCGRIPKVAHERIGKNLGTVFFEDDSKGLAESLWKEGIKPRVEGAFAPGTSDSVKSVILSGQELETIAKYRKIGGCYIADKDSKTGDLFLDGGQDALAPGMGRIYPGLPESHIYAHELGHTIDGPDSEYSSSAEWGEVFGSEINREDSPLTDYAKTNPSEGFAEFARLLYGGGFEIGEVEDKFPKSSSFFKERGLWPE